MWKKFLEPSEDVEHEILWEMRRGSTKILHENWTDLGALYHVVPSNFDHIDEELQEVADLRLHESWNDQLLTQSFHEDIAKLIRQSMHLKGMI